MTFLSDENRARLINDILLAASNDEVKKLIYATTGSFEQARDEGYLLYQFVDKMVDELGLFTPMNNGAQQWSNIQLAKVLFRRIQRRMHEQLP